MLVGSLSMQDNDLFMCEFYHNELMLCCLLLMLKGSHGFMKTHKWRDTIGAFINVEASGTGGPGKCHAKVLLLLVVG